LGLRSIETKNSLLKNTEKPQWTFPPKKTQKKPLILKSYKTTI